MNAARVLVLLLVISIANTDLINLTSAVGSRKYEVIMVPNITDYLALTPLALELNCPLLLEGEVSEKTFLKYYPKSAILRVSVEEVDEYLELVLSHSVSNALIVTNTTNILELTVISVFASRNLYPVILIDKESKLRSIAQMISDKTLLCFNINEQLLRELGLNYKLVEIDYFEEALNDKVIRKDTLIVGIINDEFLPLIAYYAGARKCFIELFTLDELVNSRKLSNVIRERGIRRLTLIASLNSLRKSTGEGNLVNMVYKSAIDAYEGRYLKVSVGVLSGVTFEDALAFMMRNLFYNELVGSWKRRLAAIYMSEGMALAKKIFRIAINANLTVNQMVSEKAKVDEYVNATRVLSSGSLITYINLHGNPLAMSPMQIGPILLSGIKYSREIPYMSPSIVLTFSCDTARFHDPYLKDPSESIALSFIARGAVAYVGAITLEFSSGIEIDTAHTELILMLLLQGKELGDIVRIVNNLHIASNKNIKPHLAAYTVLLGDPSLSMKPVITEKLYSLETVESNKRYLVKILAETPVVYLEIPVSVKSEDIKKVEVIDRNIVSWSFIEKQGENSLISIFVTRELSLEVGDFEPGDTIKVKVIIKEPEWILYLIPVIIVFVAIIIYLIERRKSRL